MNLFDDSAQLMDLRRHHALDCVVLATGTRSVAWCLFHSRSPFYSGLSNSFDAIPAVEVTPLLVLPDRSNYVHLRTPTRSWPVEAGRHLIHRCHIRIYILLLLCARRSSFTLVGEQLESDTAYLSAAYPPPHRRIGRPPLSKIGFIYAAAKFLPPHGRIGRPSTATG